MTIIRVENLGKKYILSHQKKEPYTALRDVIAEKLKTVGRKLSRPLSSNLKTDNTHEEFWALKDVSFEIAQGDRVGIIGRNGAGKSTLLKILSRITEPTEGRVRIRGRVASLLEVGTGFHPELTGRENIFLNGAILGMTKAEIKRKFDEIVAFAEVEKFLDTPVKHYSSGMYVRLAFAVAAHLEPEILVVDEVLAVGDAQFQKKCLGKMEDVSAKEGRTVVFVSHNMAAVKQLCSRAILLSEGMVVLDSTPDEIISNYISETVKQGAKEEKYSHIKGDLRAQITKVEVNSGSAGQKIVSVFQDIRLRIDYVVNQFIDELEFFVLIYSYDGEVQGGLFQRDSGNLFKATGGKGTVYLNFLNCLIPGRYFISAGIFDKSRAFVDWVEYADSFHVKQSFSNGRIYDNRLGKVTFLGEWSQIHENKN